MSAEEELRPDLKSLEAELALLCPRTDRLSRDRLMFLAGQASAAGRAVGRKPFGAAWGWPAALGALTAAAASLLTVLLWRPPPQIVERFVEVTVERPERDAVAAHSQHGSPSAKGETPPQPDRQRIDTRSAAQQTHLASAQPGPWGYANWARLRSEAPYPRLRDQVLARGLDSWAAPAVAPAQQSERAATAASYRELLDSLLDERDAGKTVPERPSKTTSFSSGAHS
jgi:hypothetical protein